MNLNECDGFFLSKILQVWSNYAMRLQKAVNESWIVPPRHLSNLCLRTYANYSYPDLGKQKSFITNFLHFLTSSVCQFSHNLLKMICLRQAIWQKMCSVIIFFWNEPKITQFQLLAMQLPSGGAGSNASHCFPHPRMAIPHYCLLVQIAFLQNCLIVLCSTTLEI